MSEQPIFTTLRKVITILEKSKVEYAIIGALPVLVYGRPRLTFDIDIAISIDLDKAGRLLDELVKNNFYSINGTSTPTHLLEGPSIFILRNTGVEIDFWSKAAGFTLDAEAMKRRKKVKIAEDLKVLFPSPEDYITMKLAMARPERDIEDALSVIIRQGRKLDKKYLLRRAEQFGVKKKLNELVKKTKMRQTR